MLFFNFSDFNKKFGIYTDSSNCHLGAIVSQSKRLIAYWSIKMRTTQKRYNTIEQELLTITEVLKDPRDILFGADIFIFTYHENLTFADAKYDNQRVIRQRLFIKEFEPEIRHIKGTDNIAADTLSRNEYKAQEHPLLSNENIKNLTTHSQKNQLCPHNSVKMIFYSLYCEP